MSASAARRNWCWRSLSPPAEAIVDLRPEVDDLVCLDVPEPFGAIGCFNRDFG